MAEIQLGAGSSSSATHRITQSSRTLDRRYVERPSNLAIEEAARAVSREQSTADTPDTAHPSRLVNLRVHAADLLQAANTPEETPAEQPTSFVMSQNVVEFGTDPIDTTPTNLEQIVPPEDTPSCVPAVMDNNTTVATTDSQELAMSIAADYAVASFDASTTTTTSNSSIDTIAQAASEAIAAIRTASDPSEIAEQVTSLKAFADNIKANSSAPEMMELSDTIEKFVEVAMKSSKVQAEMEKKLLEEEVAAAKKQAAAVKVTAKKSTPAKKAATPAVRKAPAKPSRTARPVAKATARPAVRRTTKAAPKLVADEDQALRKALRSVAAMDDDTNEQPLRKKLPRRKTSKKRFALAFFCALACVSAIVYFVASNIPDISVKVAAIQTGIEASYPAYIPRDFSLRDISSEEGKITLNFKGPEQASFTLTEEKSSWDSNTLLRNFVEPTWQTNYITTHEQGLTIYISGANAAWVNGGVLYKITAPSNSLTKKQLRNIVTSL